MLWLVSLLTPLYLESLVQRIVLYQEVSSSHSLQYFEWFLTSLRVVRTLAWDVGQQTLSAEAKPTILGQLSTRMPTQPKNSENDLGPSLGQFSVLS